MIVTPQHLAELDAAASIEPSGRVLEARGLALRVADLSAPVGASVRITSEFELLRTAAP